MPRPSPLPIAVRALLFQHLAAMEKAGLPSERAYALLDLGPGWRARQVSYQRLAARHVPPETAGLNSGLFTPFDARLLAAAFAAGSPQLTFERLAAFYAAKVAQGMQLRSRLLLPCVVLLLSLLIGPLPALFKGSLSMGGYLWRALAPLLMLGAAAVAGLRLSAWFASGLSGPGRVQLERLLLAIPVLGRMHLRRNARDFIESLAMLLQAGVPLFDALPPALAAVGNSVVRADLAAILPAVKKGAPLAQAVAALRLVDTTTLFAFVHTGEESGTLPEMLLRHANAETTAVNDFQLELVAWVPRLLYAFVALSMVAHLLGAPPIAASVAE